MSVFNCNITYKKVEGDSYTSTYNKLLSQGIVDKYLNIKTDVAKWRSARSELNKQASDKLRRDVNLFDEKILLNGIRIIPNIREFKIIDSYNNEARNNTNSNFQEDAYNRELNEKLNNLSTTIDYGVVDNLYKSIEQSIGSVISQDRINTIQSQIDDFNESSTKKTLSLQKVGQGYLIKSEFNYEYLFNHENNLLDNTPEIFESTDSTSNFNLPCIIN